MYVSTLTIRPLKLLKAHPDVRGSISDTLSSTMAATETAGQQGLIGSNCEGTEYQDLGVSHLSFS